MTLYPAFKSNRPPTLRVSLLGGETLREVGKLDADGKALLSIRHHVDTGRWQVILPYEPGGVYLPVVGSADTLRDAYRRAEHARRIQRHQPDRLLRHIDRLHQRLRTERQRARRYANTVNAMTDDTTTDALMALLAQNGRLKSDLENAQYEMRLAQAERDRMSIALHRAQRELTDLQLANNRLRRDVDYWQRKHNLPTSDDLKVVGSRPVYPLRSQSQPEPPVHEMTAIRIHAALLPPGVSLADVVAAVEVLPAPAPAETGV